jgi:hypothetical protein
MFKSLRRYALLELVLFGMITFGLTLGGAALVSVFGNKVGHSVEVGHSGFPGCALYRWPVQIRADSNIQDIPGILEENFGIDDPEDLVAREPK